MSAPQVTQQPSETSGLSGVGPHDCYPDFAVDAQYSGSAEVSVHVHGTSPKTLFLSCKKRVRISLGAIVAEETVGLIYRHVSWMLTSDPDISVVDGALVVTFEGVLGVDVEAGIIVYGERT